MTFTPAFQIRLLAILCLDKEFYLKSIGLLDSTFFSIFVGQCAFTILTEHFKAYKQLPSRLIFETELNGNNPPDLIPEAQPLLEEFFALLNVGGVPEGDYIKDSFKHFISTRQLRTILHEEAEHIDEGKFDEVVTALRKGQRVTGEANSSLEDPDHVFSLLNLKELYLKTEGIKTSIGLIDAYVGGLQKKEMTLIFGDSNVGKSLLMAFMGGTAVQNYRRVLHVGLEMSAARNLIRYFTTMANPSDNINYNKILTGEPLDQVHNYIVQLRDKYEGYLFMEEIPTGKCSIEDLYRLVDKYAPIDVLVLDYLDLMKPPQKRDNIRFESKDITTALRGLAVETGIALLTATQASRAAARRRIVDLKFVAEDYEKVRIADTVISIGQSMQDSLNGQVVLFLAKSRNTIKDKAERYFIDYNNMKFRLCKPELLGRVEDDT